MPTKMDGAGKRWVEMEFIAPGTPEDVWEAIATGPGNAAWFIRATIEERVGGAIAFDFGPDMKSTGEVTAWEPPRRFGYVERDWSKGAPPLATEIMIAARADERSLVRMVHSLSSSSDEWDDQLESFETAWPSFFEVLRLYLSRFKGQKAVSFQASVSVDGDQLAVWKRLTDALDLNGANVGEHRTTPTQPEALSGVIEHVHQDQKQRVLMMRLDAPAPGAAIVATCGDGNTVNGSVCIFFYGDDAGTIASVSEKRWRDWLRDALSFAARAL